MEMAHKNNESVAVLVRVKNIASKPHYAHLQKKARRNRKGNPHAHVGTEINALIEADFEKENPSRK
jgi:hypothetical protein